MRTKPQFRSQGMHDLFVHCSCEINIGTRGNMYILDTKYSFEQTIMQVYTACMIGNLNFYLI